MPTLSQLTDRNAVLAAIAKYEELGPDRFFRKFGYGRAKTCFVLHNGRQYDSKAIAGVALLIQHGRAPERLHGGVRTVLPRLKALRFPVVAIGITESSSALPEEPTGQYAEGEVVAVKVNKYERSAAARAECLAVHGTGCVACGFEFAAGYGPDFTGLIHVHHLHPLSSRKSSGSVDPAKDLVPVCPNCHAAIHHGRANRSIEEIRSLVRQHQPDAS